MADMISWVATVATVTAASMTAANLGARITGYGFAVFVVGSIAWLATGLMTGQPALVWTNAVLLALNLFGVWRWLGRQARVEDGARAAAEASEKTPGEALFPVTLLTRAPLQCGGTEVGHCVDAMAGSQSGRIAYVVVSEGGVGGVGERLRRVEWDQLKVEGEAVAARMDAKAFGTLDELDRDQWPAR